eukprot:3938552-Rhodomonas_salina.1
MVCVREQGMKRGELESALLQLPLDKALDLLRRAQLCISNAPGPGLVWCSGMRPTSVFSFCYGQHVR